MNATRSQLKRVHSLSFNHKCSCGSSFLPKQYNYFGNKNSDIYGNFIHKRSFTQKQHTDVNVSMPNYVRPASVGAPNANRDMTEEEELNWTNQNRKFREEITKRRRHIAKELLYGRAACYMIAKLSKKSNHKRLEKLMVDHLYALKLNKFRLQFMEMEQKLEQEDKMTEALGKDGGSGDAAGAAKKGGFMSKNRARKPALKKEKKG